MTNTDLMAPIIVDLVLRGDAFSKDGGDVIQARGYARVLRLLGDDVRLVEYVPGMQFRAGAVVHYFNADRPYEMLEVARSADARPFFVSAIHHSSSHVRMMRQAQRSVPRQRWSSRLPEDFRTLLVFMARTARDSRSNFRQRAGTIFRSILRSSSLRRCIRSIFEDSAGVFLLSERERESLSADFGWNSHKGILTPNGRPPIDLTVTPKLNRIIVVGRIESRKRQFEIAKRASEANIPLCFVGTPNGNETEYSQMFEDVIERNDNLEWIRGTTHDNVLHLMRTSKVLLNCSWVEVQSLVDLEAAFSGCRVVTLENGGSSKEWLNSSVTEVPNGDIDDALRAALELTLADDIPENPRYEHTWDSTTEIIRREYARASGIGPRREARLG